MTTRNRLPNRRYSEHFNFELEGQRYVMTIGFYKDSRTVAELFINSSQHLGSTADVNAADAAVAVSLALQHGCPVDRLREAMKRDANGRPQGPLGAALDIIFQIDGKPKTGR